MPLIFSYGTLQDERVQLSMFGRAPAGAPDNLMGYERVALTFTDPALSGKVEHANLEYKGGRESGVTGTVLSVTDVELEVCDRYEHQARYRRQLVMLESGKQAWLYTFAGKR